ncbi:MAG: phosphoenolpyruvate--protein phosphotransferase [Candidatus Omnitrophica bacterium]|nr:phosphoenolpyruvate--protein phosphotransferase [Candidatus Omnitrophota bacterium]
MKKLVGIPVSPGVASGKALVLHSEDFRSIPKEKVGAGQIPQEIARFEDALTRTRADILGIRKKLSEEIGREHSDIFMAHLLVLEDRSLIEDVITTIKEKRVNAEYAFSIVIQKYFHAFSQIDDEYLKERVSDIRDIARRVIENLIGKEKSPLANLTEKVVVIAHDLSPSDTAMMDKEKVIAFATDIGGPTSHTAIMARSMEIPAVVGLDHVSQDVQTGDSIIIDGNHGTVILHPDAKALSAYAHEEQRFIELTSELDKLRNLPAVTTDDHPIELAANIEFPEEIPSVLAHGATGIGLYRTEYFYMNRTDLPTEEEQYDAYRTVAAKMKPFSVVIRSLDLGGDKFLSSLEVPHEMNPFLGWRAIRFCLARVDIFKTQLRAVLRASVHGNLKAMYPMISNLTELRRANEILEECKKELKKEKKPFNPNLPVGAMIEIPSAALTSDALAKEVDFFSIGTNDLIQYALAVDRVNEKIAYLYEPTHPAILRLIQEVIINGHKNKIWVGTCGEMSGDPGIAVLLMGLGIDQISTSPLLLPKIKKAIRLVPFELAKEVATKALKFSTGTEVQKFLRTKLTRFLKELMTEGI